jgi:RES domain-containing protein
MTLWRISPFHDLNGQGGLLFSARWHVAGIPVVYLAESPAGALLEVCANTSAEDLPPTFTLLKIEGSGRSVAEIGLADLPRGWVSQRELTQQMGVEWLESRRSALLRVPSALVPETTNYLLNPLHSEAALLRIERSYEYPFDLRLKQ